MEDVIEPVVEPVVEEEIKPVVQQNFHGIDEIIKSIYLKSIFYGYILCRIKRVFVKGNDRCSTASISLDRIIRINIDYWNTLSREEKMFILEHEVLHLAFLHINRFIPFYSEETKMLNRHKIANIAMDCAINQLLVKNEGKAPKGLIDLAYVDNIVNGAYELMSMAKVEVKPEMNAEYYYHLLEKAHNDMMNAIDHCDVCDGSGKIKKDQDQNQNGQQDSSNGNQQKDDQSGHGQDDQNKSGDNGDENDGQSGNGQGNDQNNNGGKGQNGQGQNQSGQGQGQNQSGNGQNQNQSDDADGHDEFDCPKCGKLRKLMKMIQDATNGNHDDMMDRAKGCDPVMDSVMRNIMQKAREKQEAKERQQGIGMGNYSTNVFPSYVKTDKRVWKRCIDKLIGNEVSAEKIPVYNRPNRRNDNAMYGRKHDMISNHVYVIIDTSGSICDSELEKFISHINSALKQCDVTCTIIECDWDIQKVTENIRRISKKHGIVCHGRGGTDLVKALDWINTKENGKKARCVVLTDGYTDWKIIPNMTVTAIYTKNHQKLDGIKYSAVIE